MNKETQAKIQLLTENDLTEAMRLTEPAYWNPTQHEKHLFLENFLVYWAKDIIIV